MSTERSTPSTLSRFDAIASPGMRSAIGVVTFALLTAIGARLSVPIAGTAVPFTFQPLAVLLTGALLGARLGALSQVVYLAAGMAGLPVFATGALFAPTGGYLMAYPFAAFVVGALASGGAVRNLLALLAGLAVIYTGGAAWLAILTNWSTAVVTGVLPFVLPDLVKVVMAWVIAGRLRERSREFFAA
ncbi:MAG: biotin transporter BioY [Gemmatimonas sp.]|nr:biotin transporter BioY [Gemmatimonas sp.]